MKYLVIILEWFATRFFLLYWWFETHDMPFQKIGRFISKIGRRLYPVGYCSNCGIMIMPGANFYYDMGWAFNGGTDKNYEHPFCSSCCHSPTPEQLELYRKWRIKHPIKKDF